MRCGSSLDHPYCGVSYESLIAEGVDPFWEWQRHGIARSFSRLKDQGLSRGGTRLQAINGRRVLKRG